MRCVRGDGVNGKPENDEPEGRFVQFEEAARVAAAVCLPKELLAEAEIGNDLSSCAAKLVSFVVVGSLPFVLVSLIRACVPFSTISQHSERGFTTEVCVIGLLSNDGQAGSYPVETRAGSRASDFKAEYTWSSGDM